MTAATLDLLSGGRFLLGLGTSGPQVVEGWHGEPWGKPLEKTREYVEIVRAALRREQLEHHGAHYDIPLSTGTGLGKPLKLMARPLRPDIPIYLAVMGPKAVAQAFEIADGWLPIFLSPEKRASAFGDAVAGAREGFDIAATAPALLIDDVEAGREFLKPYYALYIGGMGARGQNFYNDLACRYGFEDAAREIQDLYLDGQASATPPPRCRTRSSTRSRSSGRRSASRSASTRGASRERPRCSSPRNSPRRFGRSPRSRSSDPGPRRRPRPRYGTPCSKRAARVSSAPSSPRTKRP